MTTASLPPRRRRRSNALFYEQYEQFLVQTRDQSGEEDQRAARGLLIDWLTRVQMPDVLAQMAIKAADGIVRSYDEAHRPPIMRGLLFPDDTWFVTGDEKRTRKEHMKREHFDRWIEIERQDDERHVAAMAEKERKYERYTAVWRHGETMPGAEKHLI